MHLDQIDYQILRLLTENSRVQWKDLRLRGTNLYDWTSSRESNKKIEEGGVIKSYSRIIDEMKLGLIFTAFVIIYMKTANHDSFKRCS